MVCIYETFYKKMYDNIWYGKIYCLLGINALQSNRN